MCTENDEEFINYSDKVKNRKITFTIKQIFKEHQNNFLLNNLSIKIRDVVYSNVNKILKCKTIDLSFFRYSKQKISYEMECPYCGGKSFLIYLNSI